MRRTLRRLLWALGSIATITQPAIAAKRASVPTFLAGAGSAEIGLAPRGMPIDGFGTILDPLKVRVLVLRSGRDSAAIVLLDQTSIFADTVSELKELVSAATRIPAGAVLICASHTFAAPHMFLSRPAGHEPSMTPAESRAAVAYHDLVVASVLQATRHAVDAMRPAAIAAGEGIADVNVNRNLETSRGWWLGADDRGPSDKTVGVVRIDDRQRRPLAILFNYAVQPSVMDHSVGADGRKLVSADMAGAASSTVERRFGGEAVAFFLPGAGGDQAPKFTARRLVYDVSGLPKSVDLGQAGQVLVELQGERLGTEAARVAAGLVTAVPREGPSVKTSLANVRSQVRPPNLGDLKATRSYNFIAGAEVQSPFSILRVGDIAIVGVQPELDAATGRAIRTRSPFSNTLIVTMVDGAAKYMPSVKAYADINYEAMNSQYVQGSAEILVSRIGEELDALRK